LNARVSLCVGVGYSDARLQVLPGALRDAAGVHELLINPVYGRYDASVSRLLQNPSKQEVLDAIADLLYGRDVETFTLFFAGHGGSKNDTYALCCSDTNMDRYALSALSMGDIFRIVNDSRPAHTNIVVDACEAAGMLNDFSALLKPSILGQANSSSMSILAMSASDRSAGENDEGGFGTVALLRCLQGAIDVRTRSEYLSLEDVGNAIAPMLGDQVPSNWSFNISGASKFSLNPHYDAGSVDPRAKMPDFGFSDLNLVSPADAEQIWREYLRLSDELDARRLQDCLEEVLRKIVGSDGKANFLLGILESLSARAEESEDAFAKVTVQAITLFVADSIADISIRTSLQLYLLAQLDQSMLEGVAQFQQCLSEEFGLLSKGSAFAEFFALPLRICKVMAWTLFSVQMAAADPSEQLRRTDVARDLLDKIFASYSTALALVSEEQAPYLHLISELGRRFDLSSWTEDYVSTLYADFFLYKGHVAKVYLPDGDVFEFLRHRSDGSELDYKRFNARPSEVLFVLLWHFISSEMSEVIRYDLSELDKWQVSTFVPDNYLNFSDDVVHGGANIGFRIGFDLFTVAELESFVRISVFPQVDHAVNDLSPEQVQIAVLASLIYPNRVAWPIARARSLQDGPKETVRLS
jgi:hypothetical protein